LSGDSGLNLGLKADFEPPVRLSRLGSVSIAHNCPAQPHTTGQRRFFHGCRSLSVPPVGPSRPSGPLTRHRQPDTIRRINGVCWMRAAAAVVLASMSATIHWVPLFEARGIVVARSFSCSGGSPILGISRPWNSTLAAYMAVVQRRRCPRTSSRKAAGSLACRAALAAPVAGAIAEESVRCTNSAGRSTLCSAMHRKSDIILNHVVWPSLYHYICLLMCRGSVLGHSACVYRLCRLIIEE